MQDYIIIPEKKHDPFKINMIVDGTMVGQDNHNVMWTCKSGASSGSGSSDI